MRAVQVTAAPTGVGARWSTSMFVPTVISPGSRKGRAASSAACSRNQTSHGVERTGGNPAAAKLMACDASTVNFRSPTVPIFGGAFIYSVPAPRIYHDAKDL